MKKMLDTVRFAALLRLPSLSARQLDAIAPYATERTVTAGGRLLLDGPVGHELVLVAAGRGRVRCAGEVVAELGPGDALGALAPRRAAYATATVIALSELCLVQFSARDLRLLRAAAPDAAAALLAGCVPPPAPRTAARHLALVPAAAA